MSRDPANFEEPDLFVPERWLRGDVRRHNADSFANLPFGHGVRWDLLISWKMCRIDILPSQILHRPTLCPPGVVHHDDEGGAEVQAGVQRGACGVHHQAGQHPGQTRQDKIYAKGLILIRIWKLL